jgi:hypothetical protein
MHTARSWVLVASEHFMLLLLPAGFLGLRTMMQATSCSDGAAGMRQSGAGAGHAKSELISQAVSC